MGKIRVCWFSGRVRLSTCFFLLLTIRTRAEARLLRTSMREWSKILLELWDSLAEDRKFEVVCGIHHTGQGWTVDHLADWSKRGAIRIYGISEQYVHRNFY